MLGPPLQCSPPGPGLQNSIYFGLSSMQSKLGIVHYDILAIAIHTHNSCEAYLVASKYGNPDGDPNLR